MEESDGRPLPVDPAESGHGAHPMPAGCGIRLHTDRGILAAGKFVIVSLVLDDGREIEVIRDYADITDTVICHYVTFNGISEALAGHRGNGGSAETAPSDGVG